MSSENQINVVQVARQKKLDGLSDLEKKIRAEDKATRSKLIECVTPQAKSAIFQFIVQKVLENVSLDEDSWIVSIEDNSWKEKFDELNIPSDIFFSTGPYNMIRFRQYPGLENCRIKNSGICFFLEELLKTHTPPNGIKKLCISSITRPTDSYISIKCLESTK